MITAIQENGVGYRGENLLQNSNDSDFFFYERERLNQLFTEAVRYPVVMVCAATGYGKTSAVHDFVERYEASMTWIQFSERDNVVERFWETMVHSMANVNASFSGAIGRLGFPDTADKQNQYFALIKKYLSPMDKRILILDDVHILENQAILQLTERMVNNLSMGTTVIYISRSTPRQNITGLISKGQVFTVSEDDLRFTENELAGYFRRLNIQPQPENLREIMQDTGGWAFAINLIARSYQKAPGYGGYIRNAMKTNIFQVMETEIWEGISGSLQHFMVRLSLIDHLSYELIELLAGGDKDLIDEMERQNAYIRRDSYINAFLIHHLFLEFLSTKQCFLSEDQKRETYIIAGEWCNKNGFMIDAMSYYEKIGDYRAIISALNGLPAQMPYGIAKYAATIFERAPAAAFGMVDYLALSYIRCYMRLGQWQRASDLAKYYEAEFLKLPDGDNFKNRNLSGLYLAWGYLRSFMCLIDNVYDFDACFGKFCKYYNKEDPLGTGAIRNRIVGPWLNATGSSKKGAPEEFIQAISRATAFMPRCFGGFMAGEEELAHGELKFFQGDLAASEAYTVQALTKAREHRQFDIQHRALLYTLRMSIAQGNHKKAEQTLNEMKSNMEEHDYNNRFLNHDISLAWYYCAMDLPENTPDWIKQNLAPYSHASSIENFENQMKARYCYITRNYPPLLAYIQEMKQRESYLFGLVEMLSIGACVHYRMKDREKAYAFLSEAYERASPNNIVMPFIELGKDMRTLTASALKEPEALEKTGTIPKTWLENINRRAASYAKRRAHVILEYKHAKLTSGGVVLSPRETEILKDLSYGLSRAEVAINRNLSINTVKMVINMIYSKMGAENLAGLIRIAVEKKII